MFIHAPLLLLLALPPLTSAYSFVLSGANRTSIWVATVLILCNPATIYASGGQLQILAGSFVAVLLYLTLSLVLWSTGLMLLVSFCFRHRIPIYKLFRCLTSRRQASRALQEASCRLDVRICSSVDRMRFWVKEFMAAFNVSISDKAENIIIKHKLKQGWSNTCSENSEYRNNSGCFVFSISSAIIT